MDERIDPSLVGFDTQVQGTSGARFGETVVYPDGDIHTPGVTALGGTIGTEDLEWSAGVPLTENLITNWTFETNFADWGTSGTGTWTRRRFDLEDAIRLPAHGDWGIRCVVPSGSNTGTASTNFIPPVVGVPYVFSAWVIPVSGSVNFRLRAICYRSDFTVAATFTYTRTWNEASWIPLMVDGTPPTDTAFIIVEISHTGTGSATYLFDAVWASPRPDNFDNLVISAGFSHTPNRAWPMTKVGAAGSITNIPVTPGRPYRLYASGHRTIAPWTLTVDEHDEYTDPELLTTAPWFSPTASGVKDDDQTVYDTNSPAVIMPTQPRLRLTIAPTTGNVVAFSNLGLRRASNIHRPFLYRPQIPGIAALQDTATAPETVIEETLVASVELFAPADWPRPIQYIVFITADLRAEHTGTTSRRVTARLVIRNTHASGFYGRQTIRSRTMQIGELAGRSRNASITLGSALTYTLPAESPSLLIDWTAEGPDGSVTITAANLSVLAIPVG